MTLKDTLELVRWELAYKSFILARYVLQVPMYLLTLLLTEDVGYLADKDIFVADDRLYVLERLLVTGIRVSLNFCPELISCSGLLFLEVPRRAHLFAGFLAHYLFLPS